MCIIPLPNLGFQRVCYSFEFFVLLNLATLIRISASSGINLAINQLAKLRTNRAFLTIFVAFPSHKVCLSCMKKINEGCTESYLSEGSETCAEPYLSDEASSYMDSEDDSADETYVLSPAKSGSRSNPFYREQKRKRIEEEEVGCLRIPCVQNKFLFYFLPTVPGYCKSVNPGLRSGTARNMSVQYRCRFFWPGQT